MEKDAARAGPPERQHGAALEEVSQLLFLAEAGRVLSSSLDSETTLRSIARLAVESVADYCVIDLVREGGEVQRVASAHRDPESARLAEDLLRYPPHPGRMAGVADVLRTGQPVVVSVVTEDLLVAASRDEDHLRVMRELGPTSFMIVPLIARARTLGAILLTYTDSGRSYGPLDLRFAEELAGHAALAIDNARLYEDAQRELAERKRARESLDQHNAFLRLMLEITTAANEAPDFRAALRTALERIRAHTRWPVGHALEREATGSLKSTGLWSMDDPDRFRALREVTESVSFLPGIGLPGRVLATGNAVAITDIDEDPSFLRTYLAVDVGVRSAFAFPVRVGADVVAVLEFFSSRSVELGPEFLEVMEHVGTQLGRVVERARARAAIRESETRFRQIAENIREVFWITDPEYSRMAYVSPAYEEIWGRPVQSAYVQDRAWLEDVHPDDREAVLEVLQQHGGTEHHAEFRVVRPDGDVRWVYARGFPVAAEGGEVFRVVGIAEDITGDRAAEHERLRLLTLEQEARERAEEALRARDEVLRMVSHDLKNPIHAIGMAAALLDEIPLPEDKRVQQIRVIRRTADHMHRLVQGLLDLRRIEAGHGIPVEPQATAAGSLVEAGCTLFRPQADAKGVSIVREVREPVPEVLADPERILQVLWNLTGNAIKFTPEGGQVLVRVEDAGEEVRFSVRDTGPGIPPEHVDRLFDPFWQDKRTARLGTGLGLPISKAIVEAHGGRIWVESTPGSGATFAFVLPRAASAG